MSTLFLICPDCFMDKKIVDQFGQDCLFLSSLGTIFHFDDFAFMEELNDLINRESVHKIYVVSDFRCTFIQNTVNLKIEYPTDADKVLAEIAAKEWNKLEEAETDDEKSTILAKESIFKQVYEMTESAFIGNNVKDRSIDVKGLLYDREKKLFQPIDIPFLS